MAIIIPHEAHLRHSLNTDSSKSLVDLCRESSVREHVLKECNVVGKKNGFKQMELLEAVVLTSDDWTPESGLVTAAQKIQRSKIAKAFETEIKAVYKHWSIHIHLFSTVHSAFQNFQFWAVCYFEILSCSVYLPIYISISCYPLIRLRSTRVELVFRVGYQILWLRNGNGFDDKDRKMV